MAGIAVVTDSTADLPAKLAEERGLRVVPMSVSFGEQSYISRITITDAAFYERLRASDVVPTTSQPAPAWFEEAYADAADEGCDGVVSVHVSAELSGTTDLARQLAAAAPLPVEVVDSRQVGGGLALAVLAAQRCAGEGGDLETVARTARTEAERSATFVVVDTLEYLKRSGRVSGARALVGSVLRVRPVLATADGKVEVIDRARTFSSALRTLVDHAHRHIGDRPARVVITHAVAPDRAEELFAMVAERIEVVDALETVIGPILGAHAGPGTVGVSVVAAEG